MHAIQVQNAPMVLKRTLAPGVKLLGERLVETTNRAGAGRDSHQRLSHFPHGCRVLTPATNISVSPCATWGSKRL